VKRGCDLLILILLRAIGALEKRSLLLTEKNGHFLAVFYGN